MPLQWLSLGINPQQFFSFYSQTGIISLYDCIFKRNPGYNQKLHRDDREHAKGLGLHINEEVRLRILIGSGRWTVHAQLFIIVSSVCLALLCAALL